MELKVPECVSLRSAGANGIHLKVCTVGVRGGAVRMHENNLWPNKSSRERLYFQVEKLY